jgi:hypothetical protein
MRPPSCSLAIVEVQNWPCNVFCLRVNQNLVCTSLAHQTSGQVDGVAKHGVFPADLRANDAAPTLASGNTDTSLQTFILQSVSQSHRTQHSAHGIIRKMN